jgi:hypothetical protein
MLMWYTESTENSSARESLRVVRLVAILPTTDKVGGNGQRYTTKIIMLYSAYGGRTGV